MTDTMREMIAQLMGTQKEGEEGRDLPPYDHVSVCRAYLVGCCPYELVPDSRLQGLLSCRKLHEPAHKADFQKAQDIRDHFYDVDAFEALENAITVVDGEITRIKAKLDRESREQNDSAEVIKSAKMTELDEKISKAVDEMETLGTLGKVEDSIRLSKQVEDLRMKKVELEMQQQEVRLVGPGSNASRLRVCDDCGAQLNILDHETRIADHFNGKMHLGMVEVRDRYNQMKENIEERRKERKEKLGTEETPRFYERRRSPPRRERESDRRDDRRDERRDRGDRDRRGGGDSRRRSRSRSRDRGDRRRDDRRDHRRDDRDRDRYGGRNDRDRRDRRY